jgi:hypothetical protein
MKAYVQQWTSLGWDDDEDEMDIWLQEKKSD